MAKHFVEAEELQAYLDGELEPARRAEVERHVAECGECVALLAELKRVSATLQRWQVEPAPASLRPPALEGARRPRHWGWRRLALAFGGTAAVVLLVFAVSLPNFLSPAPEPAQVARAPQPPDEEKAVGLGGTLRADRQAEAEQAVSPPSRRSRTLQYKLSRARAEEDAPAKALERKDAASEVGGVVGGRLEMTERENRQALSMREAVPKVADQAAPVEKMRAKSAAPPRMVARQVAMTVEVKEFEAAKEKLLKTVEEAGGYMAHASVAETPGQPRRAEVTVRVPVAQLPAVLEQLRGLGRVLHEQLSTEEVTEQVVDLEARLRNARATEKRLLAVLEERTGEVGDILEVEREIARTRGQIERMEAQRENLLNRVKLATLRVTLVEEFKAQLEPAPVGTGTRLRNALVEGYKSFVGTLLGFLFFFARYGLTLLFWGGLLWLGWRGVRRPVLKLVLPALRSGN